MIVALAALTALVVSVIVHLCATRLWPRQNHVFTFLISGFVVGVILLLILLKTRSRLEALEAALIYAFACELYIFLFTFVVTSISVAILVWLKEDGRLPESRMEAAQDDGDFVGGRINRMVESGIFQKKDEQLSLTAKGRILLAAYKGLRSFFGHQVASKETPKPQAGSQLSHWVWLPIILAFVLFFPFLTGDKLFIGNFDRLNSHLNILWLQAQALRGGLSYGWTSSMFLGTNLWALIYAPPNPEAIVLACFPESSFLWLTAVFSCLFFIVAGLTAFAFLRNMGFAPWLSATGCCLYQLSYASTLRIAQNDLTYLVIAVLPAGFLGIRLLFLGRERSGWLCLFGSMLLMALFGFLQETIYALIAIGCYAGFWAVRTHRWKTLALAALAASVALIACMPRVYVAAQEFKSLKREEPSIQLKTFDEVSFFQNIGPRELLRVLHYGAFGRFLKEGSDLGNNINITEGVQTHSSTLAALVMLAAGVALWITKSGSGAQRELAEMRYFAVWVIGILLVTTIKPLQEIIYYIFLRQDFTHSRLCITALLPIAALVTWFLQRSIGRDINRDAFLSMFALGGVAGGGVWFLSSFFPQDSHILEKPIAMPLQVAWQIALCSLVFFFMLAVIIFWRPVRTRCAIFAAGFMLAEAFLNGAAQFHSGQVQAKIPFESGNSFFPPSSSFSFPTVKMRSDLLERVGWPGQNTVFVRAQGNLPPFLASYLGPFYGAWCVDGYSTGVPRNLLSLGWPDYCLGLRTMTFGFGEVPWNQLALLGVRSLVQVDDALYSGAPMDGDELSKRVQTNPSPALPRVFWAGEVRAEKSEDKAARLALDLVRKVDFALPESLPAVLYTSETLPHFAMDQSPIVVRDLGAKRIIRIRASNQPRLLVFNERYHPAWKIDGRKGARLYEANGCVQAIVVPPGVKTLTLRFEPVSMWLLFGLPVLSLSLGLLGGLLVRESPFNLRGSKV